MDIQTQGQVGVVKITDHLESYQCWQSPSDQSCFVTPNSSVAIPLQFLIKSHQSSLYMWIAR